MYTFFSDSPAGQIRGWLFTHDSSIDVKSPKDVPFNWGSDRRAPKFWG